MEFEAEKMKCMLELLDRGKSEEEVKRLMMMVTEKRSAASLPVKSDVKSITIDVNEEQDPMLQFITEQLEFGEKYRMPGSQLCASYVMWHKLEKSAKVPKAGTSIKTLSPQFVEKLSGYRVRKVKGNSNNDLKGSAERL